MRKGRIVLFTSFTIFSLAASFAGSIAWFNNTVTLSKDSANISGASDAGFFAYGDGSSVKPFGINTPRHLYNLAWLQYLGHFNNNTVGPKSGPCYFEIDPKLQTELNMDDLTIPPIGTNEFPFVGFFNGNGKTISNLSIDNVVGENHITKVPTAVTSDALANGNVLKESTGGTTYSQNKTVNMMGMFGKTDTRDEGDNNPHIYDFKLKDTNVSSSSNKLVVGVAAGYLDSKMSNVSVVSPEINITNTPAVYDNLSNISEYTLVGYATSNYVQNGNKKIVEADKPIIGHDTPEPGAGSEFGASIPMKDIYNKLLTVHNASEPYEYNEIWDGDAGQPGSTLTKEPIYRYRSGTDGPYYFSGAEETYNDEEIAAYTFAKRQGVDAFMYLYGEDEGSYQKTIDGTVSVQSLNEGKPFCIGDGNGNWIGCTELEPLNNKNYDHSSISDSTYSIINTTDLSKAVKWVYANGRIRTSEYTRTSSEWTSTIRHYGFLTLDNTNTLKAVTGKPNDVGFPWTKEEFYETVETEVEVGDGTYQTIKETLVYRIFMTSSQNGELQTDGRPYSAYLICNNGNWTVDLQDSGARYFMYGDKYLKANPTSNTITLVDSIENASEWYTGTNGGWMVKSNGTFYTLGITIKVKGRHWLSQREYYQIDSNLKFSSTPETLAETYNKADTSDGQFRLRGNIQQLITNIGALGGDTKTDFYFYLVVNGNNVTAVTQQNTDNPSAGSEFKELSSIDEKQFDLSFKTTSTTKTETWQSNPTYFPLSYEGGNVSSKNTGYIVSGANYVADANNWPGDIRVSDYTNNRTNNRLSASLGGGYTYDNLTIVTHERSASGGWVAIKDDYNSSLNDVPSTLSGVTSTFKEFDEDLGLVRYHDSRRDMHTQFTNDFSQIHGLHFMNAEISMNNLIEVPNAHILGDTYTNYEMPEDCIDFNLKKNGYITFYAGTYFSGNNTFFSLHEIKRNKNTNKIESIKEISKIYDNQGNNRPNKRYIYYYSDGTNNLETGDTQASLLFDMTWVTNPTIVNNAVYYFEIPVTNGEYALGSVSGKTGAYLMYLDIGSAQKNEDITTITENILTTNYISSYVSGVDFTSANSSASVVGGETGNITIPAGATGTYSFSFAGTTLTYDGPGNLSTTHVKEGISVSNNLTDGMETGDIVSLNKVTTITYDDFDEKVVTDVTETTTINGGNPSIITYNKSTELNVQQYDWQGVELNVEGTIIRFRYWGGITFDTDIDYKEKEYLFIFNTSDPLDIYVESLTPGETGYTVKFVSNVEGSQPITAVQSDLPITINSTA